MTNFSVIARTEVQLGCDGCPDKSSFLIGGLGGMVAARALDPLNVPFRIAEVVVAQVDGQRAGDAISAIAFGGTPGGEACRQTCHFDLAKSESSLTMTVQQAGVNGIVKVL